MVPPTGASDSILVVRRNGASLEPYYGALAPQLQNYPMDPNDGRVRKTWGERWKVGKAGKPPVESQMIEASNFMVHPDYLTKYGTLSNGVLTKSIKYAETWLYGTVGVRGAPTQRPSLFLYPGVVAPTPRMVNQGNYLTSPAAYLGVPAPNYPAERNGYVVAQPRKKPNDLQPYQCGDCGKDIRSGTCSLCKKCVERRTGTCRGTLARSRPSLRDSPSKPREKRTAPDPYNLMRKSRLGVGEPSEPSMFSAEASQRKKRTASASPLRRHASSPSFETFKPKHSEKGPRRGGGGEEEDWTNAEEEVVRRKSILECEVNAYELNKSRREARDEDDDDDSGDEFPEASSKVGTKLKILRPKLSQTEPRKSERAEAADAARSSEVRLNGQRFKIFDHSTPSTSAVEGYVSDDEECKKAKEPLGMIPRLPSPKRPPRRPKDKVLQTSFKYSKSKSKSSPNLSIKSILKKPGGGDDFSLIDFGGVQCEETPAAQSEKPPQQSGQSKKQSQSTLKKKKQVQFRVSNSNESLDQSPRTSDSGEEKAEETARQTEPVQEPVHRSKSCENLSFVSKVMNEYVTGSEVKTEEERDCRKEVPEERERVSHAEDESVGQSSQLKRSYSDRRPSSAIVLYKDDLFSLSTSPPNSYLFNDTMALRTRATRLDTRGVFIKDEDDSGESRKTEAETRGPLEKSSKLPGNFISYEEFSRLTDGPPAKKEIASTGSKSKKSPAKRKSAAPNPPPRQATPKANKAKNSAVVSVQVVSEEPKSSRLPKVEDAATAVATPESEDGRTVVTLIPDRETRAVEPQEGKRASVTIHPKNVVEVAESLPQRKTSVLIAPFDPQDSNKVTISVRSEPCDEEHNSSTCTIIETGSNSTVIPVVSTDNKTTLIVGSTPVASPSVSETPPAFPPPEEVAPKPERPSQYIFSSVNSDVAFLDPVEAVRRNLVPHICGKEENGPTLMEKIKQSRETKEQKHLKQISQLFGNENSPPAQFLLPSYRSRKGNWKNLPRSEEDSSTTTSRSNSFCSTLNGSVNSNTSRSSSFRSSSCYKSLDSDCDSNRVASPSKFYHLSDAEDASGQERDKLEYEYEIGNGFKDEKREESENIYETIKEEPIYDQIGAKTAGEESEDDVPPPLPLTLPPSLDEIDKRSKSIFEGASKYDILNYLVDAKDRVQEESYFSGSSASEDADGRRSSLERGEVPSDGDVPGRLPEAERGKGDDSPSAESDSVFDTSSRTSNLSQASYSSDDNLILASPSEREAPKLARKSSAEIERNDSGVGSETSHTSRSKWQATSSIREDPQHLCEDCDQVVETQITDSGVMYAPLVCRKCSKRRSERKEIIQEIVETEEKYGRDLKIILEEFYTPMLVAGLLTPDQLSAIFLNTEELLENSEQLTEKLRDTLEIALDQGDEDLQTVNVGRLFLEAGPMLHAFESYCTRQGAAAVLLANLEKEKELLRIFLRVSQMENAVLRRMNLNSFLMVPVQRVTKYPLLLARLYKVTPPQQEGRELLKEAQHNIELHLEHMNSEAKDVSAAKVWRRFSTSTVSGRKSTAELEMINIKLRKMAVDVLDWNHEEVRFVMEGKLLYTQPTDNNWKKGRTIKLTPVFVLLATLGKPNSKYKMYPPEDELTFPTKTGVREATLLLVKEKCGRYTLIREPLYLDKIIVCCETDVDEFFEVQELSTKDSFIFKAEDGERTKEWYRYLQYHAQILGSWRRRRNALANIMINGMMARGYAS